MTLRILDLEARHYFFIRDKEAEEYLKNASLLAESLQSNGDKSQKSEEGIRDKLKENLSYLIGFRKAEKIASQDLKEIFSVLHKEAERIREYRAVHDNLFTKTVEESKRRHPNPDVYAADQIKRDSVYHTLERSGSGGIFEMLGYPSGMEITEQLIKGASLADIVDERILKITEVLPSAMLFSFRRRELEEMLSSYSLDKEQISKIMRKIPFDQKYGEIIEELTQNLDIGQEVLSKALQTYLFSRGRFQERFQKFVSQLNLGEAQIERAKEIFYRSLKRSSRNVDYAGAMKQLSIGNLNLEWVLSPNYRNAKWYPLARMIQDLDLKRYGIQYFHTPLAGYVNRCSTYYGGYSGIPNTLLTFLEEISGVEAMISKWDTVASGGIILYPKKEISSATLGILYGLFILGHGCIEKEKTRGWRNQLFYSNNKRREDSLISILEKVGLLREKLPYYSRTLEDLKERFKLRLSKDAAVYKKYHIPFQYHDLVTQIPNEEFKNQEFARSVLKVWIEERGHRGSKKGSYDVSIDLKYEYKMRELASIVGLSVSGGHIPNGCTSKKVVYINNAGVLEIR